LQLVNQFAAGAPITISFPQNASATFPDDNGGFMSVFSAYGPSFDFELKPAISAPGGNILSTFPVAKGSYAVLSGTSMSTPFAAGGAALLLSAKGKSPSVAKDARTLFETTSSMIPSKNDTGFETLAQAGAGLINVYKAIHSTTFVSPGQLILNDTAHFIGK
jgi:subtilisin family serine protease